MKSQCNGGKTIEKTYCLERERERQTDRQTDKETERQRESIINKTYISY